MSISGYATTDVNTSLELRRIMFTNQQETDNHDDVITDKKSRFEQDQYIITLYESIEPIYQISIYPAYHADLSKSIHVPEDQRQDYQGIEAPIVNIQKYVIQTYLEKTLDIDLSHKQCDWMRRHGKVQEFIQALHDAKRSATWHRNDRPESNYKGHWYIEINDARVDPPLDRYRYSLGPQQHHGCNN